MRRGQHLQNIALAGPPLPLAVGTVGAIHELAVSADLLRRGYAVFRALSPSCSCDLVIMKNGVLQRVEVTSGRHTKTKIEWLPKDPAKFDLLAVVTRDGQIHYTPEVPA